MKNDMCAAYAREGRISMPLPFHYRSSNMLRTWGIVLRGEIMVYVVKGFRRRNYREIPDNP